MKKIFCVMLLLGVVVFAGSAWACDDVTCPPPSVEKTWTVYDEPDVSIFFGTGGVISHQIKFDITTQGFIPGSDVVNRYDLSIDFHDDSSDRWYELELAKITAEGHWWLDPLAWDFERDNVHVSGTSTLNLDGTLLVSICRISGDFYYDGAELDATGCTTVPEPASMLLLGLGLMGLAGIGKKCKK